MCRSTHLPPYMHFMRETPNGGCLNQNLRTLPRESPATGCSLPWASLPSHPIPVPSAPTRPPSCHAEYLEPGGLHSSTSVLSPGTASGGQGPIGAALPCEYGVTHYREAAQIHVHRTKFGGLEALTCLESLGDPLWGLRSAASPLALFPSLVPCPNDQGPDSPGT